MAFRFDSVKGYHIILFLLHSLGGSSDVRRLFLMLYLSDLRHLARYGTLILADSYIALKYGPAPFNTLGSFRKLEQDRGASVVNGRNKQLLAVDERQLVTALARYNRTHLSDSEVECMFEVVHRYKDMQMDELSAVTKDSAWHNAGDNGEITLREMALAAGASDEMISYIEVSRRNELNSFAH